MSTSPISSSLPPLTNHNHPLPPFPPSIPTAPLLIISLSKLLSHDPTESTRFFTACKDLGFFYLDLKSTEPGDDTRFLGDTLLDDANALFDISEEFFNLPLEEKMRYDFSGEGSYFGYKGLGKAVVDRRGTRDRNEFYNISKNDILSLSPPLPSPPLLHPHRPLLSRFIQHSHTLVTLLLTHLTTHLHLHPGTLQNLHRLHVLSGDQVRFVKAPPPSQDADDDDGRTEAQALGEHTDFGSVTVLFNRLGGLQVKMPAEEGRGGGEEGEGKGRVGEWVYVRPLEGHVVVNLGDAMVKFTNGLLRSNIHRVVSPPGEQRGETRYSVVYFCRPEDGVLLKRLEGGGRVGEGGGGGVIPPLGEGEVEEEVCARDWIIRRALGRRVGVFREGEWERGEGTERLSGRM